MKNLISLSKMLLFMLIFLGGLSAGQAGVSTAQASIYEQSVDSQDLQDNRSFLTENYNPPSSDGGLSGLFPGFTISWAISYDANAMLWDYEYTLSGTHVSNFYLELTNPSSAEVILNPQVKIGETGEWTPTTFTGPQSWDPTFYGIKFDERGNYVSYSFETAYDPVWGNFCALNGIMTPEGPRLGFAYNNASMIAGFDSDDKLDFVPRPMVPEPISSTLFLSGGAALVLRGFIKKRKTHNHNNRKK